MLSHPDAELAARDRAVPGLALLLDPEALAEACRRRLPELGVGAAHIEYVRYKPGTNCLAGYRFELGGALVEGYAKAFNAEDWSVQETASKSGAVRFTLEGHAIAVFFFPNDSKLPWLRRLGDAERRLLLLPTLFPDRPGHWDSALRTLRYKPERRYVGQLLADGEPWAVAKVYGDPGYETAAAHAKDFRSHGRLQIARRIARSNRGRMLLFEWLDGRLLAEAIGAPGFEPGVIASVGEALAELHGQRPKALRQLAREAEAEALFTIARGIAVLCPALARQADRLALRLAGWLSSEPLATSTVHGDFYAKQVLLTGGDAVAILDLDQMACGDSTADLGNFIAHLESDALRGTLDPRRIAPLGGALLDGYCAARRQPTPAGVEAYTAAALFRLAHDPFRHREADWPDRIAAILDRAETLSLRSPKPKPSVPGKAPSTILDDPKLTFLAGALDPAEAEHRLGTLLGERIAVRAIRVVRHKPGRRCLIEYDIEQPGDPAGPFTLIGKVHARRLDRESFRIQTALWDDGFGRGARDGVCVSEPIGMIPDFQMWLQRKVPGTPATKLLAEPGGAELAARIAGALHKLHRAGVATQRCHGMADELRILHERLPLVAHDQPHLATRIDRILAASNHLAASIPEPVPCGIHRDFYTDQVLIAGPLLYLLDLDLYCEGDPGLDVGNFIAHLTEHALRKLGDPRALADREEAMVESFVEFAGERVRASVRAYTLLTLVRHIYISTLFETRTAFTEPLLDLCEQRFDITMHPPHSRPQP